MTLSNDQIVKIKQITEKRLATVTINNITYPGLGELISKGFLNKRLIEAIKESILNMAYQEIKAEQIIKDEFEHIFTDVLAPHLKNDKGIADAIEQSIKYDLEDEVKSIINI